MPWPVTTAGLAVSHRDHPSYIPPQPFPGGLYPTTSILGPAVTHGNRAWGLPYPVATCSTACWYPMAIRLEPVISHNNEIPNF